MISLIFSTFMMVATSADLPQCSADQVLGIWANEDGTSHIEIYRQSGKYYGKISWAKALNNKAGKPHTDRKNPDPTLRDRPILGMDIISGLSYSNCQWTEGEFYIPSKGKTADCSITLNGNHSLLLTVSISTFSTTKKFTRL
ncbi:MAG: DUF2147 domain-containing protein [Bacteroidota bacterium]